LRVIPIRPDGIPVGYRHRRGPKEKNDYDKQYRLPGDFQTDPYMSFFSI
jgi:hypothetical protein